MARINRRVFCETFIPMAKAGKSALEIGQALGIEGEDKKVSQAVSVRAANYRKELKTEAKRVADEQGLSKEKTEALMASCAAKMPKLTKRSRDKLDSFADFLDGLLEDADTTNEGEETAE